MTEEERKVEAAAREHIAQQLTTQLIKAGAPPERARAMADVAIHATHSAVERLQEICRALPYENDGDTALLMAAQMCEEACQNLTETVAQTIRDDAAEAGLAPNEFEAFIGTGRPIEGGSIQ